MLKKDKAVLENFFQLDCGLLACDETYQYFEMTSILKTETVFYTKVLVPSYQAT